MDALRFTAAAFITLYHVGAEQAPRALGEIHPVFERGFLATDFFLILSGYILARTYGPRLLAGRMAPGDFLLRRLARIWPAHLLVLSGFAAVVVAAGLAGVALNNAEAFSWDKLLLQAVFAHAWGLGAGSGWNFPTWTLSALVVCYALFPALWRALSAVRPVTALAIGVGVLAAADLIARSFGADIYKLSPAMGLGRGLPLFVLGAAIARYAAARPPSQLQGWLLGLGGLAALAASQVAAGWGLLAMLGIGAVILAAGTHAPRRPSKIVAEAAVISFALFITHNLLGLVWFKALGLLPISLSEPAAWAAWAAVFPASLLAALAFHHWIDMPIQAWIKPRLPRARGARAPASAAPLPRPA